MTAGITGCQTTAENKNPEENTNIEANTEIPVKNEEESEKGKTNEYNIFLDVNTEKNIITGIEKVKIKNNSDDEWDKIYFNTFLNAFEKKENAPIFDNAVNKVYKYGADTGRMNIIKVSVQSEEVNFENYGTVLEIKLDNSLKPESEMEMTVYFEAEIPKICHRTGCNDKAIWCGNFIPNLCVYDKGWKINEYCKAGEPSYTDMANYSVKIKAPDGYTVVGSGTSETEENDDGITYSFNSKMIRDFAFALSNEYKKDTKITKSGIEINYYHYTDGNYDNKKISEEYLDMAEKSIDCYSEKISPYPYMVLNIAEVELWGNLGMEYPEVIFMDSSFIQDKSSVASIAHETAHQWFYNIIGNDQYSDAWLDEGLASFMELNVYMNSEEIKSYVKLCGMELKQCYDSGYDDKGYITDRSINEFESWGTYYYCEYEKPMVMLYELKKKIGEKKFDEFIKEYYESYSFRNADREKFQKCAEKIYGEGLDDFFVQWLDNEGIPEIIWEED